MEPEKAPAKLRIIGLWCGTLEDVPLDSWTLDVLREEISRRCEGRHPPECINLISGGRVLRDKRRCKERKSLLQFGLKSNSKILASAAASAKEKGELAEEEAWVADGPNLKAKRLEWFYRARAAAERLSRRGFPGNYHIELKNQVGEKVILGTETDQRAVLMGIILQANGKRIMDLTGYRDALDIFLMAEEAFSRCNPKVIRMIDNVSILQIDIVWCYFMQRDISLLSMAGIRLAQARKGLEHGIDPTRILLLPSGRNMEAAIYLRLELLEGIVAYHNGQFEQSRVSLTSAEDRYSKFKVPEELVGLLVDMGYEQGEAKMALQMPNLDFEGRLNFLDEERERLKRRWQEGDMWLTEIEEQKQYGMSPQRNPVNLQHLKVLESMGFERTLAAEALRVNENDIQKALDGLTDPEKNLKLQLDAEKRVQRRLARIKREEQELVQSPSSQQEEEEEEEEAARNPKQNAGDLCEPCSSWRPYEDVLQDFIDQEDAQDIMMESGLAHEIIVRWLEEYDFQVDEEGEAIAEYLALLDSTR